MSFRLRVVLTVVCAALAAVSMAAYAASVRGKAGAQREGALERYGGEVVVAYVTTRDIVQGPTRSATSNPWNGWSTFCRRGLW